MRSGGIKRPGQMNSWHQQQAVFSPFSLFPLLSSLFSSSPLCSGRWGNPGLFLAWLAYHAIRGLDEERAERGEGEISR